MGRPKVRENKFCLVCNTEFYPNSATTKYCSIKCRSLDFRGANHPRLKRALVWDESEQRLKPEKYSYFIAVCKRCGQEWRKREDTKITWAGYCYSCSSSVRFEKPNVREKQSALAKAQILRQGGIPNGHRFTTPEVSGANGYNWKGGITPLHRAIRTSTPYKEWRKKVFDRDNFTCTNCGKRGGIMNAHHIQSFADFPELRFDVSNGATLCTPCHKLTSNFGSKSRSKKTTSSHP